MDIFFGRQDLELPAQKSSTILFVPINDGWNDFGYRCRYSFFLIEADGAIRLEGEVFLGFTSQDENIAEYGQVIIQNNMISAADLPDFFTIQGGMGEYREFVNAQGADYANEILLLLNDLVAMRRNNCIPSWYPEAEETEIFRLGFMRTSGRFFAYHNAASLLGGLGNEGFSGITPRFHLEYQLSGVRNKNTLALNFDLDSCLPKRMNVLIGRNGLGKSQALFSIADSLLSGGDKLLDDEGNRPLVNRLLAVATPGETINSFPPQTQGGLIEYRRLMLDRESDLDDYQGFGGLCVQLARLFNEEGIRDRWKLFKGALSCLSDFENILIPLRERGQAWNNNILQVGDQNYIPLIRLAASGEQANLETWAAVEDDISPQRYVSSQLCPLSSGELAFIKFALQACLFIENGTLVLIDEPETHLHPNLITIFVQLLDRILKATGSIAVIATHSAYFVREVPRAQVLVFKQDDNNVISIQNPRLKTFGADVGSISYFVFEDDITNILIDEFIENLPESVDEKINAINELEQELSAEVIMYLRRQLKIGGGVEEN